MMCKAFAVDFLPKILVVSYKNLALGEGFLNDKCICGSACGIVYRKYLITLFA